MARLSSIISFLPLSIVFGFLVAGSTFIFGLGVCWLFLFGDSAWPQGVFQILGILSVLAGVFGLVTSLVIQTHAEETWATTSHKRLIFGCASLLVAGIIAGAIYLRLHRISQQTRHEETDRKSREGALSSLLASLHNISSLSVQSISDGFSVSLSYNGERSGLYERKIEVFSDYGNKIVLETIDALQLTGTSDERKFLSYEELIRAYIDVMIDKTKKARFVVNAPFKLRVTLLPKLTQVESDRIPSSAYWQVVNQPARSQLLRKKETSLPVHFFVKEDGSFEVR